MLHLKAITHEIIEIELHFNSGSV